ncbi:hypothetical protein FCM35_KLT08609 [Carex littledalei]|uniref:Uncharacterized protein n=1 Tax=Carex littledalei TaxID=544730 RepID=A0A833QPR1_9POAL|nr:hypothetical protein FCM35_KLT08609 [Carex littledalei]
MLAQLLKDYLKFQSTKRQAHTDSTNAISGSKKSVPVMPKEKNTLAELKNKTYSFGRDKVAKAFHLMMQKGLNLPVCKHPEQASRVNEPDFCPYHCILGHTIDDCWVFKDLLENKRQEGTLPLTVVAHLEGIRAPIPHKEKGKQKMKSIPKNEVPSQFEVGDMVSMLSQSQSSKDGKLELNGKDPTSLSKP